MRGFLLAVIFTALPAVSFAFDAKPQPPVTLHQNANCSFGSPQGFGKSRMFGPTEGERPTDLGSGRFAQRYVTSGASWYFNQLVVVDCSSSEAVAISAPASEMLEGLFGSSVDNVLHPRGPLVIGKGMTVDQIAARAAAIRGVELTSGSELKASFRGLGVEPFCGCSVLYPESPKAKALKSR